MNVDALWNNFLEQIKQQITSLAYQTWFSETKLIKLSERAAVVLVPSYVHKKHLSENYAEIINEIFNQLTGTNFSMEYVLQEEIEPLEIIQKQEISEGVPRYSKEKSNLKSKYTFDTFLIGESNRFAHTTAVAVAESPGKMYNPLFIYGKSGLGKTHLMQAIGNYIVDNSNKNVLYITSDQFIADFLGINKRDENGQNFSSIDLFKEKYRNIDVLIIDDIQFLAGANQTQTEFFHTFNNLYDANKQIIISSDRSPDDLKLLEERLRTRFYWGMTVNILPPDLDLRINILKNKISAQKMEKEVPIDVIEYIANNCESDIRQLEGAITRLYAYSAMFSNSDINLEFAVEALKDFFTKGVITKNNITKIQKVVADYYKITVEELKGKKRQFKFSHPRQIAMYLCRILTDESYPRIGSEFGGKDHSTVIHAYEKIDEEIKKNESLRKLIDELKKLLTK